MSKNFEVLLVRFPFTDLKSTKLRPALSINSFEVPGLAHFHIVAMMTSQIGGISFPYDVHLSKWKEANLPKETLVRLAKLVTIENSIIKENLGVLEDEDAKKIKKNLTKLWTL